MARVRFLYLTSNSFFLNMKILFIHLKKKKQSFFFFLIISLLNNQLFNKRALAQFLCQIWTDFSWKWKFQLFMYRKNLNNFFIEKLLTKHKNVRTRTGKENILFIYNTENYAGLDLTVIRGRWRYINWSVNDVACMRVSRPFSLRGIISS